MGRASLILLLLLACKGKPEETGIVLDCDQTDPGGELCSVDGDCRVVCYCSDGSTIESSRCEGVCPTAENLCEPYCAAVGWSGLHCYEPET